MKKKRSVEVTISGWLLIVYSLYTFLLPTFLLFPFLYSEKIHKGPIIPPLLTSNNSAPLSLIPLPLFLVIIFILAVIVPLCSFICGVGVLRLKSWGMYSVAVAFLTDTILKLFLIALPDYYVKKIVFRSYLDFWLFILFLVFDIAIIIFFTHPKVKEQFR